MPVHNAEIADIFNRLADLLEIDGANPFRVRAYRNAGRVIGGLPKSAAELLKQGKDLSELPGIGKALAAKIATIVGTGTLPQLKEVAKRVPVALATLMRVEGIGPKRVKALYDELGIRSIEDLKRAARTGRIRTLEGFGEKTEQTILAGIERVAGDTRRVKLAEAEQIALPLTEFLASIDGVKQVAVAGSYRRRKETVGDLDILVTATRGSPVMDRFASYDEVTEVLAKGATRSTVRLRSGLQVDLRVVAGASYGAALHYFTGSKAHNIAVRTLGAKKGLKINEYGVFAGTRRIAGRSEEEVFAQVGLPYIPPELRENRGELEAARTRRLPELVELDDIRGDLHCHTKATDGRATLEEMAMAAREHGYEYLAVTDHSRHVAVAHGLDAKRLAAELEDIDRLNDKLEDIVVLKSVELDILDDGSLDLPDSILKRLDLVVAAVHYRFGLSRRAQTDRIMRALDNRRVNILAHPSGRLINEREAYEVDMERILERAKKAGCFVELNAHPDRLDLDDAHCMLAKQLGLKVAISTDAHSLTDLDFMRFGIGQARRGWLEPDDVINTRPLADLRKLLGR